jgi:hypothetical protein
MMYPSRTPTVHHNTYFSCTLFLFNFEGPFFCFVSGGWGEGTGGGGGGSVFFLEFLFVAKVAIIPRKI